MSPSAEVVATTSEKKGKRKEGLPTLAAFNVKMPVVLRKPYAQECVDLGMGANALAIHCIVEYLKKAGKIAKDTTIEIPKSGGVKRYKEQIEQKDKRIADLEAQLTALKTGKK